jgi:hypothetical protein
VAGIDDNDEGRWVGRFTGPQRGVVSPTTVSGTLGCSEVVVVARLVLIVGDPLLAAVGSSLMRSRASCSNRIPDVGFGSIVLIRTTTPPDPNIVVTTAFPYPTEPGRVFSENWAPVNLPDGLVVWDVGWGRNGGTYGAPFTEQLFGRYDSTNTTIETGLLVRIQGSVNEVLPADSNPRVTVRGTQGWVFNPDASSGSVSIEWVESGRQIAVQGRGVTLDEAVTALDALQWRLDGTASFEPTSSQLPLLDEASSGTDFGDDETTFSITDPDGPAPVTGPLGSQDPLTAANDVIVVQVGASVPGALTPELVFRGKRRIDGAVVSDGVMVEPGGRIIHVLGGGDKLASPEAILEAVSPISGTTLRALVEDANSRVLQLPEVLSSEFPEGKVTLRGGTSDWPLAICLAIDATERCRSVAGLHQFASWENSVSINDRWFIVGRQPANDPSPAVYPWTPETPAQFHLDRVFRPIKAQLAGDQLLWLVEIPPGTDVVGVGHLHGETVISSTPSGSPSSSALRRPDE